MDTRSQVKLWTRFEPRRDPSSGRITLSDVFSIARRPMQRVFYQLKYPFPVPDQQPKPPVGHVFLVGKNSDGSALILRGKSSANTYTIISGLK
jgi:hypothetical protein